MVASGTLGFGGGGGVRGGRRLARRPPMVLDRPSTRLLVDRFGLRAIVQSDGLCLNGQESALSPGHPIHPACKDAPRGRKPHRRGGGSSRLRDPSLHPRRWRLSDPMGGDLHGYRLDFFRSCDGSDRMGAEVQQGGGCAPVVDRPRCGLAAMESAPPPGSAPSHGPDATRLSRAPPARGRPPRRGEPAPFPAPSPRTYLRSACQRPSKAAQVWPSKIAHLAEVTSL